MTPKDLNPSLLEKPPLPHWAMKPAIARLSCLRRQALTARFPPHFIA